MEYELKKEGRFEYLQEGEGPVIIFLHGLFGQLSNFKDVISLKTNYKKKSILL